MGQEVGKSSVRLTKNVADAFLTAGRFNSPAVTGGKSVNSPPDEWRRRHTVWAAASSAFKWPGMVIRQWRCPDFPATKPGVSRTAKAQFAGHIATSPRR